MRLLYNSGMLVSRLDGTSTIRDLQLGGSAPSQTQGQKKFSAGVAKGCKKQAPKAHSLMLWRRGEVGREQGDVWGECPKSPRGDVNALSLSLSGQTIAPPPVRALDDGNCGCLFFATAAPQLTGSINGTTLIAPALVQDCAAVEGHFCIATAVIPGESEN